MKAFVVSHGEEDPSRTWAYIAADSAEQIHATFRDLVIHEPPPAWATPSHMEDFGAYTLTGPADPWLEKLRRKPA